MMMKYLWAAFAAASAYAQEIASPLPPEQMIAPEDKSVLDSQAKEILPAMPRWLWEQWWEREKSSPS